MKIPQEQNSIQPNIKKYVFWNVLFLFSLGIVLFLGEFLSEGLNRVILSLSSGDRYFTEKFFSRVPGQLLDYWFLFILLPSVLIYQGQKYFRLRAGKKIFAKLIVSAITLSVIAVVLIAIVLFVLVRPSGHSAGFAILALPLTLFYSLVGYSVLAIVLSSVIYLSETSEGLRNFLVWVGRKAYIFGYLIILLVIALGGLQIFTSQTCIGSALGGRPDAQAGCYADVALGKNDPSECQNAIKKDLCLVYLSQKINLSELKEDGFKFCNRVSNASDQISCLQNIRYYSDKKNLSEESCNKFTSELVRNHCYYLRAGDAKFSSRELCDKITDKPIGDDLFLHAIIGNEKSVRAACLRGFELNNSYR